MAENYLMSMAEDIRSCIPGNPKVIEKENVISITGKMDVGVKGIDVNLECSKSTVKVKGTREYKYPLSEEAVTQFQKEMLEKHQGYSIYVSGQVLSFSKFFSYQSMEEAIATTKEAIEAMTDAVLIFEKKCVNFQEKNIELTEAEEYDPEKNVDLVKVDNTYHAVALTELDNQEYEKDHQDSAKEIFENLAHKLGCTIDGNEFVLKEGDRSTRCILFPMDAEILVSVSIPVPNDVGAMYVSYVNSNYPELLSSYDSNKGLFSIRKYSSPDKYAPEETEDLMKLCNNAMDTCISDYQQTLEKKDSTDFASDVQQILVEQTETIEEKEKALEAREEEMLEREAMLNAKEAELNKKISELENEKVQMKREIENERIQIQERERKMKEEIKVYEERNTKDILNIQQLANQVNALKKRQSAFGQADDKSEEEIFRLKSKVQQLTSQKITMEKKLLEKMTQKDARIQELSDIITQKDFELQKNESSVEDIVKSKVGEEVRKKNKKIKALEKKVSEIGHILTVSDLKSYFEEIADTQVKIFHTKMAYGVMYNDESLEIKIWIGDQNFMEVSKEASIKDSMLKKLNSKYPSIKFFTRDNRVIARAYFKKNAAAEDVDDLVATLSENFSK